MLSRAATTKPQRVPLRRERNREPDTVLGQREQRELRLHDDAERAFAADEPVDRIVRELEADGVLLERGAAQIDDRAVGDRDAERAHVRRVAP